MNHTKTERKYKAHIIELLKDFEGLLDEAIETTPSNWPMTDDIIYLTNEVLEARIKLVICIEPSYTRIVLLRMDDESRNRLFARLFKEK